MSEDFVRSPELMAMSGAAATLGACLLLVEQSRSKNFSLQPFEGKGSAPRIQEAEQRLQQLVPIGSSMADYKCLFQSFSSDCGEVADRVRFPDTIVCYYKHGFLISSEWKYVVKFDPATGRSKRAELNFALTGP